MQPKSKLMTTGQRKINIQQKNKYSYHYRMLLSLGIPIVVGQVGTIILGFADTLMVGHHSVMELAAASFVNTIMAIILVLALGFSYGLTPMVGQLFGRGEREKIGSVMKNGLAAGAHLLCGLGGSLDVFAGVVERAPKFWSDHGLEWFYRLCKEPRRIGRMMKLPLFLVHVKQEKRKK